MVVTAPGVLISVQVPVAGNPFKTTLPVASTQVGWVIVPTVGVVGAEGTPFITTLIEATDAHPAALVIV